MLKWIIAALAVLNFGYMFFDGAHALFKGDYIRPQSGKHAGQLGPWSKLVEITGINPESFGMKFTFLVWGLAGLVLTGLFIWQPTQYRYWLLGFNVFTLWYLIPGTVLSFTQVLLLLYLM